jgi:hypothetical protein
MLLVFEPHEGRRTGSWWQFCRRDDPACLLPSQDSSRPTVVNRRLVGAATVMRRPGFGEKHVRREAARRSSTLVSVPMVCGHSGLVTT